MKAVAKRKKNSICPVFSSDTLKDRFVPLYVSQIRSKAYTELSISAKQLYIIMRVHAHSKEGRACLAMHGKETGIEYDPEIYFVFPASHQRLYGYTDRRNVDRYIKELERAGFIVRHEKNWNLRKVTVYKFVSDWKG